MKKNNFNKKSLVIIGTPITAYMAAKALKKNQKIDILFTFAKDNYETKEVIDTCLLILNKLNINKFYVLNDFENWSLGKRKKILKQIEKELSNLEINISEYEKIFANPFVEPVGFYISSKFNLYILSHGFIDYLRYKNYLFERLKTFIKTFKYSKSFNLFYGLNEFKKNIKKYINLSNIDSNWDHIQGKKDLNFVKDCDEISVLFAWAENAGYYGSYDLPYIEANKELIKKLHDFLGEKISFLFIKIHRRSPNPSIKQKEEIKKSLAKFASNVFFIDELFEEKLAKYIPGEIFIEKLKINNVVSNFSSLSWQSTNFKNVNAFSYVNLKKDIMGLKNVSFLIKELRNFNKLVKKPPIDLEKLKKF